MQSQSMIIPSPTAIISVDAVGGEQLLGLVQAALSVTLTAQLLGMDTGAAGRSCDLLVNCSKFICTQTKRATARFVFSFSHQFTVLRNFLQSDCTMFFHQTPAPALIFTVYLCRNR